MIRSLPWSLFLLLISTSLFAAPTLRLATSAVGPVAIASGGPGTTQVVEAWNAGDGSLSLTVTGSDTWLTPTIGASRACTTRTGICLPISIALPTSSLAKGTYTGTITVSDPNAVDAPQTITVTVGIGGSVPDQLEFYLAPGGTAGTNSFTTGTAVTSKVTTQGGGQWLAMALDGGGTFQFNVPYKISATPLGGLGEGTYKGSVAISGSSFAEDNKTVPVTMHITTQPIAVLSASSLVFQIAQGMSAQAAGVAVQNSGQGSLAISDAAVTTTSGADWLKVETSGTALTVTADPGSLGPGKYEGSIAITSNAANSPSTVSVVLNVVPQTAPQSSFGGVVNNATFQSGDPLAPGDISAIFGSQFSFEGPQLAGAVPLPTQLGTTPVRVLVNGQPAPLYYASYGQINFQLPFETQPGEAIVQVERGGQSGNQVSVQVTAQAPRILRFGIGDYGIIQNASQQNKFPLPPTPGVPTALAKPGDVLVIYAVGFGATKPAVLTGAGAPSAEPLARVQTGYAAWFGTGFGARESIPAFIGLSPGFVGLYQVNAAIPAGTPSGLHIPVLLQSGDILSNTVEIAVQ